VIERRLLAAQGILIAALLLAYSNSFGVPFLMDDVHSIVENGAIQQLSPLSDVLFPPPESGRTVEGRPMVSVSVALNYALGGLNVWGYHAFNLAVHALAALTLFGLVRRTLQLPRWRARFEGVATPLALAVALLWGLHPLQTESVTYIIQRAESMVGLFYLLTLYSVVRGELVGGSSRWFIGAIVFCALGMATKEVMVTAPVVVLLLERVFVFDSLAELFRRRWQLLAGLAATWLILAALIIQQKGRGGSVGLGHGISVGDYLATQFGAIVLYLRLTFSPTPLVFDYGTEVARGAEIVVPAAIVALLAGAALTAFRFQPWVGFLLSTFFIVLAPSSSVVPIVTQTIAEHRMYLPLAAVVTLTVMSVYLVGQKWLQGRNAPSQRTKAAALCLLTLAAAALGLQTWVRNLDYQSELTLWTDTLNKRPGNARAYLNVAKAVSEAGNPQAALPLVSEGIRLDPRKPWGYHNRGVIYMQLRQLEAAIGDFDQALALDAQSADAFLNRGVCYRLLGQDEQALADFNRALELNPGLALGYRNRAGVYFAMHQYEKARSDAQKFLALGGAADAELKRILEQPK
jgi:tetratricopeptide (TPR) repeat protein